MNGRRRRRWNPGKGFIKTMEHGHMAVWMKPLEHGCQIAVYIPDWWSTQQYPTHWRHMIVEVPRGSRIPINVMDKPWRLLWTKAYDHPYYTGTWLLDDYCLPSHKIYGGGGHRRSRYQRYTWHNRRGGKPAVLPPKINKALRPGYEQDKVLLAYHEQDN